MFFCFNKFVSNNPKIFLFSIINMFTSGEDTFSFQLAFDGGRMDWFGNFDEALIRIYATYFV